MLRQLYKMKLIGLSVLVCATLSSYINAQASGSLKLGEFYPSIENNDVFDKRVNKLVGGLRKADKDTSGYINIYENGDLAARLNRLTENVPELRKRIFLFNPGVRYRVDVDHIEFWLVPKEADPPFPSNCVLCSCPTIEVAGTISLFEKSEPKDSITFTASVSGAGDISYHWTISDGIISGGQGTPEIEVKPNIAWEKDVIATVQIGGLNPICNCMNAASFGSKFPSK